MKKDKTVKKAKRKTVIKNKLKRLIGSVVLCVWIAVVVIFIALYKEPEEVAEIIKVNGYDSEIAEFVMENDDLKFVMDASTSQFSVETKNNGTIWYSNPENAQEDDLALNTEKNKLNSTLILTYSTINGVDTLFNNYTYSMEKGIYDIEQGEDYIKVYYSIGDTEKEYIIPPVIRAERMEELMAAMDKGEATRVGDYYKKYDINDLGKKDNKEELLANYPILADEVIYVLRNTAKDNIKSKLEGYFSAVGYTLEEYAEDKNLDMSISVSEKPVFNVNMIYRLEGNDLVVEIPLEEIEYKEDYPIYNLSVLPFFGAGGTEDEGYMIVPEGGGALIRFNNGKTSQNSYYANVYGWDMAQDRNAVVHETRTYYNVFGEVKNNSSFLCILEQGASYASIQADISGRNNSYNAVNAVYSLVHREQYDVSDRINAEMYVYEESLPKEDLIQRYRFTDADDYSEMAKVYQEYLLQTYEGVLVENTDTQAPVAVEVLGAVDKVKQILGIPVSKPLALTTYEEAENMIDELTDAGLLNLSVKITGWMNGGVQQKLASSIKPISSLGSQNELQGLIDHLNENEISVYLDGVTNYAYDSNIWNGFFSYTDAAKFVSKDRAELFSYHVVTYNQEENQDPYYLLKGDLVLEMAQNLIDYAGEHNANVSFADYGYELSSDFNRKNLLSRQQAQVNQTAQMKEMQANGTGIMINMGNDYAIPYSDIVVNMDFAGSEYTIIDQTIPFYQLALHGYVNYTGEALNLTQNGEEELLKSAEYGAGLSFTIMDESAFTLQNTLYTEYFGAEYSAWRDKIVDIYNRYNQEMGHVFQQKMVSHSNVMENLTCTEYEDGTKVYVNYRYKDLQLENGVVVPARDYLVIR